MNYLATIISILICAVIFLQLYKDKIDVVKLICLAIASFFCIYVVTSSFFLMFDRFKIIEILCTVIIIEIITVLLLYKKGRTPLKLDNIYINKQSFIPIIVIILVIPFTHIKFDFLDMRADQGVYQAKTLELLYGSTDRQVDFEEYGDLNDKQKDKFAKILDRELVGFYQYDEGKPVLTGKDKKSDVSAFYHGIPTYPAILALWADIFGVENMSNTSTLFLILSIFFVYFICDNLKLNTKSKIMAMIIFAFSPSTIWVSKSAMTEMFLTLLMCLIIYFMTEKDKKLHWISALYITTFAFFHVSIYTILPLFEIVYFVLFFYEEDDTYLDSIIISSIGFLISFFVSLNLSATYILFNYDSLYNITGNIINRNNLRFVVVSVVSILVVAMLLLKYTKKRDMIIEKVRTCVDYKKLFTIVIRIAVITVLGFVLYKIFKPGDVQSIKFYTVMSYIYITGFIVIPIIYVSLLKKPNNVIADRNGVIIVIMFIYLNIIYSMILRQEVTRYYYFTRYLVPFIPVISVLLAMIVDKMSTKVASFISIFVFISLLPYNYVLATQKDSTILEWNVLKDVAEFIDNDDIVIVDDSNNEIAKFYLQLRALTGAKLYPSSSYPSLDSAIYDDEGVDVYFLTSKNLVRPSYLGTIVYRNTNSMSLDNHQYRKNTIPLPLSFVKSEEEITLIKYNKPRFEYEFLKNDFSYSGFEGVENNCAWIGKEKAEIQCNLEKQSYMLLIEQGTGIPLAELGRESIRTEVYVNNEYIDEIVIDKNNNGHPIQLLLEEKYIQKGENIIEFRSELWSPSEYGSEDKRNLGLAIKSLKFRKIENKEAYDFGEGESDFSFAGFSGNEGTFRWTDSNIATIDTILDREKSYEAKIYLITSPPNGAIVDNKYGYVTINDSDVKKELVFETDKDYAGFGILKFEVGADELTNEIINTVKIHTDLWSPLDFGISDERTLGIPIDKIIFTPIQ